MKRQNGCDVIRDLMLRQNGQWQSREGDAAAWHSYTNCSGCAGPIDTDSGQNPHRPVVGLLGPPVAAALAHVGLGQRQEPRPPRSPQLEDVLEPIYHPLRTIATPQYKACTQAAIVEVASRVKLITGKDNLATIKPREASKGWTKRTVLGLQCQPADANQTWGLRGVSSPAPCLVTGSAVLAGHRGRILSITGCVPQTGA